MILLFIIIVIIQQMNRMLLFVHDGRSVDRVASLLLTHFYI